MAEEIETTLAKSRFGLGFRPPEALVREARTLRSPPQSSEGPHREKGHVPDRAQQRAMREDCCLWVNGSLDLGGPQTRGKGLDTGPRSALWAFILGQPHGRSEAANLPAALVRTDPW